MSRFRRDNIRLVADYSTKTLVHRILPMVVNLKEDNAPIDPRVDTNLIGSVYGTIEGANSVGSTATAITPVILSVDADGNNDKNPWAQINQNAFRVNTLQLGDITTSTVWHCSAMTWQVTQVEEDR